MPRGLWFRLFPGEMGTILTGSVGSHYRANLGASFEKATDEPFEDHLDAGWDELDGQLLPSRSKSSSAR